MKSITNDGSIGIIKSNLLGISEPLNRPTLIALSLGMSAVPSVFGQINFDLPQTIFNQTDRVSGFVVADFDRDGLNDLAVTNKTGVSVYRQNVDGTFTLQSIVDQGGFSRLIANDIDMDGDPDLLFEGGTSDEQFVEIALNDGSGSSWQISRVTLATDFYNELRVGDIDGDGDTDIIELTKTNCYYVNYYQDRCDNTAFVLENTGNGFLAPRMLYERLADDYIVRDFQIGDFDHDGDLDIANLFTNGHYSEGYFDDYYKSSGSQIDIYVNDGTGNFPTHQLTDLPTDSSFFNAPRAFRAADLDGDGDLDFAIVIGSTDFHDQSVPARFRIAVNDGLNQPLSIQDAIEFGHGDSFGIEAADIDTDGRLDLIFTTDVESGVFILPNLNGIGFKPAQSFPTENTKPRHIVARDMNNDGQLDLLTLGYSYDNLTIINNITPLNNPVLEVSPLIRGEQAQVTITGLQPNEAVWVGMTNHGWANTVGIPFFGGISFDLAGVGLGVLNGSANADGTAVINMTIPPYAPLGPVLIQAVVHRGANGKQSVKTPFIQAVVQN